MLIVLALLIALAARVDACPDSEDCPDDEAAPSAISDDGASDLDGAPSRTHVRVDIETSAATARATPAAGGPPLADVIAAAVRAAGLADDPAPSWRWRSRLAGLVPMVSVRGGRDDSWNVVDDPTIHRLAVFDVRATWRLERLVFDPNEPRIAAIDVARRRERRRVAEEAIVAYRAWARAASSGNALRLDEAVARLDVLTDGWFSEVARGR